MPSKKDKKKAGGARRTATTYEKQLKRGKGTRIRHKKGSDPIAQACARDPQLKGLSRAILGFNSSRIILECGTEFTRPIDGLEVFHTCTKPKGHDGFHGFGCGRDQWVMS